MATVKLPTKAQAAKMTKQELLKIQEEYNKSIPYVDPFPVEKASAKKSTPEKRPASRKK